MMSWENVLMFVVMALAASIFLILLSAAITAYQNAKAKRHLEAWSRGLIPPGYGKR
jgi:NADH:ubiquinone oxidoreductase subunit 3 (subunit A)